jgi:predicted site-specific integrase-resolvase
MALLTVRAAAEQLGVAYSTLKRWFTPDASGPLARKVDTIAP